LLVLVIILLVAAVVGYLQPRLLLVLELAALVVWVAEVAVALATIQTHLMLLLVLAGWGIRRGKTVELEHQLPQTKEVLAALILEVVAGQQIDREMLAVLAVQA